GRMRSRRRYRRRSRRAAPAPSPRLREVDLEVDLAGQALEFLDAASADQLAQRNDDGVGLRLEAEQLAGLFDDLLGKIQGRPHTITPIPYASGCQFHQWNSDVRLGDGRSSRTVPRGERYLDRVL